MRPIQPLSVSSADREPIDWAAEKARTTKRSLIDVFDRVCTLASRTGRPLTVDELTVARRLILVGATNPEAVLSDVRAAQAL